MQNMHLPYLEITHIRLNTDGDVVELGVQNGSHRVWSLPYRTLISLYRAGIRFFMWHEGKILEIFVENAMPMSEPRLRTVADRVSDQKLYSLPLFAGSTLETV